MFDNSGHMASQGSREGGRSAMVVQLDERSQTAQEHALAVLHQDIMSGVLPPGAKLKIRELVENYKIGATPLREALSQLVARNLVVLENNRGFSVAPATMEKLIDITASRQLIEAEVLRLAMRHGDLRWEDEIVASYNLLDLELVRCDEHSKEWLDRYEEKHHRFHSALLAGCPYQSVRAFCDELYVQMTRYRRLLRSRSMYPISPRGDHRELMEHVLSRQESAIECLKLHIGRTAEYMQIHLNQQGMSSGRD
ncbi:GntR family transcriptional regulator [Rhizobium sp. P38BS-XIX]|uniref:GntR family transcriptional regulator n=1 Tax=Rhizobium sp. P38BS-XIX TaxID=2726740 RepID=UPI00145790C4|nr:GntR family transcriptional regulator [Rhizobium sp. P38BS-XIX]NLS01262.1 GntR family transcriptional regulator [Rhizobium sp. P38BS-XIX]